MRDAEQRAVLIAGCGFVGAEAARRFLARGWRVTGLTHAPAVAGRLPPEMDACACDIAVPQAVQSLRTKLRYTPQVVISAVSSGHGDADVYRAVYLQGCRNLADAFPEAVLVFVSSTSVYAQDTGEWVDETSPSDPFRETGRVLLEAEKVVLRKGGMVARPAGIYGPGRSVLLQRFLAGEAVIEGDGARYINQAHRDDVASALVFLCEHPLRGEIYNICDNEPLRQLECYRWLAEHFGRPLPPVGPVNLNRKRGFTNKRVSNRKLRAAGWEPEFPSFREGIQAGMDPS